MFDAADAAQMNVWLRQVLSAQGRQLAYSYRVYSETQHHLKTVYESIMALSRNLIEHQDRLSDAMNHNADQLGKLFDVPDAFEIFTETVKRTELPLKTPPWSSRQLRDWEDAVVKDRGTDVPVDFDYCLRLPDMLPPKRTTPPSSMTTPHPSMMKPQPSMTAPHPSTIAKPKLVTLVHALENNWQAKTVDDNTYFARPHGGLYLVDESGQFLELVGA